MRRSEEAHHTPAQVAGYIADAAKIVVEAELHPDFQVPAFLKAVELLASKQIFFEQPQVMAGGLMQVPRGIA